MVAEPKKQARQDAIRVTSYSIVDTFRLVEEPTTIFMSMIQWEKYTEEFKRAAKLNGFNDDYVERCLAYAIRQYRKRIPIIYDQRHLAELVGYQYDYLLRAANASGAFYRSFKIPKKSGGYRKIDEPLPSLKEIQRWILDNILYKCTPSRFAKAFIPGRSIKENARFHRDQEMVLTVDVRNFFGSIKAPRVYSFYRRLGYRKSVASILTELCVLRKKLPQGAPTSPALSNQIVTRLDRRLSAYSVQHKIRYTRYADDITFSGSFDVGSVIRLVRNVLRDEGMSLNESKTKLMLPHNRQEVTGIIVNKKLQVPRKMRRELRKQIYYIEKFGLDSHVEMTKIAKANYVEHLKGIANFILFINPYDRDALKAMNILKLY